MTDVVNEPLGLGAEIMPPVDPTPAPTEPMAAAAPEPSAANKSVSIPKRWLLIGGGAVLAVVLLGGTFAAGAAVGSRAGRLDTRGMAMQGRVEDGSGAQQDSLGQFGRPDGGRGSGHERGPGGQQGWGGPQDGQRDQLETPQTPNSSQ